MNTTLALHTEIDEIKDAWNSIEERNGRGSPLESFAYTKLWYEQFSTPDAVRVFSVWSQDRCMGILPMQFKSIMGFRYLASLLHDHSWHCPRIILRGKEPEVAACLLRELANTEAHWSMCKLIFLYSFDAFSQELEKAASSFQLSGSFKVHRQPTYCVDLTPGFEMYLQRSLCRKTRQGYRNKLARIKKRFAVDTVCLRGMDAAAEWDAFLRIEDSGWKGDEKSSILRSSPEVNTYYRRLNDILIGHDSLCLFLLLFDGIPAAGHYCYIDNGVLHTWKCGYVNDLQEFSPSNILRVNMVKYVAEHMPHIRILHDFPNTYGYKHKYTHAEHSYSNLFFFRNTPKGRLMKAAYSLKRKIDAYKYKP